MSVHVRIWRDWEDEEPLSEYLVEHVRIEYGQKEFFMRAHGHVIDVYLGPAVLLTDDELMRRHLGDAKVQERIAEARGRLREKKRTGRWPA